MDLTTRYLGMSLKNPLVPSASPLSKSVDMSKQLEDAGASALIMYSLFEEAVRAESESMERFMINQNTGFAEAGEGFMPDWHEFSTGLDQYLESLSKLKASLDIPVIASLNGVTPGGWIEHAKQLEQAGADALELNVYYIAADINQSGQQVEDRYVELLKQLKGQINIPVNMKLSSSFSSVGNMVRRLAGEGADGVALFNRFYQPDINVDTLRLQPSLHPSTSAEALLAMRWVAILYGRIENLSIGATGGIHTAEDVIKLLLAGADVVHLCSVLLKKGAAEIQTLLTGLEQWMEDNGFESVSDMRGRMSALAIPDPAQFERANYVNILDSYSFSPGVLV